ncbi:MAG: magnesium transporter CorA family protein [Paracoccaceae bacterium]
MITAYRAEAGRLRAIEGAMPADPTGIVWIDLHEPDAAEETQLETALGIEIPTREDMQEIEVSSRLYSEEGALFLTAQVLATPDGLPPELGPVTFVLTPDRLVTVRYHAPRSIKVFAERAAAQSMGCTGGQTTLLALMETVVDRLADILEGESRKLDFLTKAIFDAHRPNGKAQTLAVVLQRIGRAEDMNSKTEESLSTLLRVLGFLATPTGGAAVAALKGVEKVRLKTLSHDIRSLQETAARQARKIQFQLDATLGVINIRQADIIKIFSVVAFVFLPPTLIASIYGMNFVYMPELKWPLGYPMALGLMALSALLPYAFFRWKKWL